MRFELTPHPSAVPSPPFAVWASAERSAAFGETATLNLWFEVSAPISRFVVPPLSVTPVRCDNLWRSTCFECFLKGDGEEAYQEWNFSPSGDWAAYDFTGRREGMGETPLANPPYIRIEDNLTWWSLGATFTVEAGRRWALGLSAVIEEANGVRSYWALAHGGEKPDFHDPACFTGRLG